MTSNTMLHQAGRVGPESIALRRCFCLLHSMPLPRKQYYFRHSQRGLLAWDVDRLVQLTSRSPRKRVPLSAITELDEHCFGDEEQPTWRTMLSHIRLIEAADLAYPIILSASGAVMDGMHRIAKAVLQGRQEIEAVQFDQDPPPDHVGRAPHELPY